MRILFYDPTTYKPYTYDSLDMEPLGGSEATLLRIAQAISKQDHKVHLHQPTFSSTHDLPPQVDVVVCMRSTDHLPLLRTIYPRAKLFLWTHDILIPREAAKWELVQKSDATVICVSQWHKVQTVEMYKAAGWNGQFKIEKIYNPIDDNLKPNGEEYDKNRIVFFSSPHKGLGWTFEVFERLVSFAPELTLFTSNPGYLPTMEPPPSLHGHVTVLGALPHSRVLDYVRGSLCCLHLNHVFPETFGLVSAEANAVGTPVLTSRLGANPEVLYHPNEMIDTRNVKLVVDRVMSWYKGFRPKVRAKEEFRTSNVIKRWYEVLK
jgi:glycosyltransferase involved in cell wall biosynthesis